MSMDATRGNLLIAYVVGFLILVLCAVDMAVQHRRFHGRRSIYSFAPNLHLVPFFLAHVGLVSFIEVSISKNGTGWEQATLAVVQVSSLQAMVLEVSRCHVHNRVSLTFCRLCSFCECVAILRSLLIVGCSVLSRWCSSQCYWRSFSFMYSDTARSLL